MRGVGYPIPISTTFLTTLLLLFTFVNALDNVWLTNYKQNLLQQQLQDTRNNVKSLLRVAKPSSGIDRPRPVVDVNGTTIPDYDVMYEFEQLVDHTDPSRGTFQQRFYHTWEYYVPGGPIYLFTPGESPIDVQGSELYLTNASIAGTLAQSTGGAVIVLEHRFYGASNPTPDHSVESLALHTIDQALDDFVYFAQNFDKAGSGMPGGNTESVLPHRAPWIFIGGSYPGAVGAWIMEQRPGVFWASYSSSGVVEPQLDFHQYWDVVEEYMPRNCSSDFRAIISYIDGLIDDGDQPLFREVQRLLGLPNTRPIDLVYALSTLVSDWQLLDVRERVSQRSNFFNFCNALETNADGDVSTTADGWGLEVALLNLARYVAGPSGYFNQMCRAAGAPSLELCFVYSGFGLARMTAPGSVARAWSWTVCNEVGWQQIGPSEGGGLLSKHFSLDVTAEYCYQGFPRAFESPSVEAYEARVERTRQKFRGFETNAERVFVVNGRRDPWIGVSLSSPLVPPALAASTTFSTPNRPVHLTDAFHCSDVLSANADFDDSLARVRDEALTTFGRWVEEFRPRDGAVDVPAGGVPAPSVDREENGGRGGWSLGVLVGVGVGWLMGLLV